MAVAFEADPTFTPGAVTELFEMAPYHTIQAARRIAVAPDGQRFLILKNVGLSGAEAQIIVVQNWHEELKRLVPVD